MAKIRRKELFYIVGENIKWCNYCESQQFLIKLNTELSYDAAIPFLNIHAKK